MAPAFPLLKEIQSQCVLLSKKIRFHCLEDRLLLLSLALCLLSRIKVSGVSMFDFIINHIRGGELIASIFTATTLLQHSSYLMFTQGLDNAIMCTPLSINIDMVYSVNRTFILRFMPSNALDTFSGVNYITVTILENGK